MLTAVTSTADFPMLFKFSKRSLVHPSEELKAFVDGLIERLTAEGLYYKGPDRRRELRHTVAVDVNVVPLDNELQPIGEGFAATTRDISSGGLSLIHFDRLDCPFLAVEITTPGDERPFRAAVEVLRCRPIGPYFQVAGKFVTKLYITGPPPAKHSHKK